MARPECEVVPGIQGSGSRTSRVTMPSAVGEEKMAVDRELCLLYRQRSVPREEPKSSEIWENRTCLVDDGLWAVCLRAN